MATTKPLAIVPHDNLLHRLIFPPKTAPKTIANYAKQLESTPAVANVEVTGASLVFAYPDSHSTHQLARHLAATYPHTMQVVLLLDNANHRAAIVIEFSSVAIGDGARKELLAPIVHSIKKVRGVKDATADMANLAWLYLSPAHTTQDGAQKIILAIARRLKAYIHSQAVIPVVSDTFVGACYQQGVHAAKPHLLSLYHQK